MSGQKGMKHNAREVKLEAVRLFYMKARHKRRSLKYKGFVRCVFR